MKRDVLDDLIDTCKSCLVVTKSWIVESGDSHGTKSSASKERYVHLSSEKTQETLKSVTKKLYG